MNKLLIKLLLKTDFQAIKNDKNRQFNKIYKKRPEVRSKKVVYSFSKMERITSACVFTLQVINFHLKFCYIL